MSNPMKPTEIGDNKTGTATSSRGYQALQKFKQLDVELAAPDTSDYEEMRLSYSEQSEPVGTMPPPVKIKGRVKSAVATVRGESANVLLDKLGERLAFERAGVRLYDALLVKLQASHAHDASISVEELEAIREDELRHAGILATALESLGADPTAVTPSADVAGVMGGGFVAVLTDAKTTLSQCLNAMLMVELADVAAWELLIELSDQLEHEELADQFRMAAEEEDRHEMKMREWLRVSILGQADTDVDPETKH